MQPTTTRTGKPGRPRNPQVEARDERIYRLIAAGYSTRRELARAARLDRPTVQLCCQRLHRAGRIRQCLVNGAIMWSIADDTPCP